MSNVISWWSHGVSNFAATTMRLLPFLSNYSEYCALAAAPSITATRDEGKTRILADSTWNLANKNLMLVLGWTKTSFEVALPIANKDGHSFNDSKKSLTLVSPMGTRMPLSCANFCKLSKNHCEDTQKMDNPTLNQAFLVSKLACVFQRPQQALYAKTKNRCPLASNTPARMSFHILWCKSQTVKRRNLICSFAWNVQLLPTLHWSKQSIGNNVHHDPNIELWMQPSLLHGVVDGSKKPRSETIAERSRHPSCLGADFSNPNCNWTSALS